MKRFPFILKIFGALVACAPVWAEAASPAVGDVINADNVEQYAEYLAPGWALRVSEGEEIHVFETTPWKQIMLPKWQELTEENRGKAKLIDEAGTLAYEDDGPWPGGVPFPEPETALEVMVNFQFHIEADDWSVPQNKPVAMSRLELHKGGKPIKQQLVSVSRTRMTSRAFFDPMPSIPGYEDELERTVTLFLSPYDVNGLATLSIIYRDQSKLPNAFAYVPVLRRVRRTPTNQRADSVGGTDLTIGDLQGFSDPLGMWDFKILGRRSMLATMTRAPAAAAPPDPTPMVAGRFISPYASAELRDTYIIEAIPKYDTIYSKKILYLDAHTFRPTVTDFYDKQGKLLKSYHIYWSWDNWPNPRLVFIHNLQTRSVTTNSNFNIQGNVNPPLRNMLESSLSEFSR
ncbi:MAG: outer membrane lipoprotein-sorting protein [Gammaproteobacteria bacterium]|nr:MAG: outer membrane lipoprotein-sorting protein [Gammaproteobacteria bacterium]